MSQSAFVIGTLCPSDISSDYGSGCNQAADRSLDQAPGYTGAIPDYEQVANRSF
jgi:hypothetical protein